MKEEKKKKCCRRNQKKLTTRELATDGLTFVIYYCKSSIFLIYVDVYLIFLLLSKETDICSTLPIGNVKCLDKHLVNKNDHQFEDNNGEAS